MCTLSIRIAGIEAEIICGEWSIANDEEGEEDYNIIIPILKTKRHPNFTINLGEGESQFVANDIAVIFVDDSTLENVTDNFRLYPACLPEVNRPTNEAIHSGWSTPPSEDYIQNYAAAYTQNYQDFFKQWHYDMTIIQCKDPTTNNWNEPLTSPSNSYYPPGTICAKVN